MGSKDTTVSLPATAWKGMVRDAGWTVDVEGAAGGHGRTLALARKRAAESVARVLASVAASPVFATDTQTGALIVAIPDGAGCAVYRVHDGRVALATFTTNSPREYVAAFPEYVEMPRH